MHPALIGALLLGGSTFTIAWCGVALSSYRRLRFLVYPFWPFSWLSQTVPLHLIFLTLIAMAGLGASGAARFTAGLAGLGLSIAAIGYWGLAWYRSLGAGKVLDTALAGAVGSRERTRSLGGLDARLRPWHSRRPGIERITDLAYGPHGVRNRLDLYRSTGGAFARSAGDRKLRPILIQIHGGAWVLGRKGLMGLPLTYHMAGKGWLVADINYRLGPGSRFPSMLEDVLRAIAWVREHAREYGGDPGFITLSGGSAGGHLSALAGLMPDRQGFQPGFERADTSVSAVVPLYGRYDLLDRNLWVGYAKVVAFLSSSVFPGSPENYPELWRAASVFEHVHADAPAFFVLHGTHDCLIPVEEAREFVRLLRGQSKRIVAYAELPGAQHAFDLWHCPWTDTSIVAIHDFLEAQHAAYSATKAH